MVSKLEKELSINRYQNLPNMQIPHYDAERKLFSYVSTNKKNKSVLTSLDAFEIIFPFFSFTMFSNQREKFIAIFLDQDNLPLGHCKLSSLNQPFVEVDIKKLIDQAVA